MISARHYQENRLDLLSRLAGDISHEIKNPLHAMVINLELVRRRVEKDDGAAALERVAVVEDEIRKVHALANALLEALRPPRDTQETCAFGAIFHELAPLVHARARCARVNLTLDAEPAAPVIGLPAADLRLLLLNLADRAVRAAGANGALHLAVRAAPDAVVVELSADAPLLDEAETHWLDDAPASADHVDLGLRVMRDLVERAAGGIDVTPAGQTPSRVSLRLPAAGSA